MAAQKSSADRTDVALNQILPAHRKVIGRRFDALSASSPVPLHSAIRNQGHEYSLAQSEAMSNPNIQPPTKIGAFPAKIGSDSLISPVFRRFFHL